MKKIFTILMLTAFTLAFSQTPLDYTIRKDSVTSWKLRGKNLGLDGSSYFMLQEFRKTFSAPSQVRDTITHRRLNALKRTSDGLSLADIESNTNGLVSSSTNFLGQISTNTNPQNIYIKTNLIKGVNVDSCDARFLRWKNANTAKRVIRTNAGTNVSTATETIYFFVEYID